jgi:ABC-2 type transport system permease protein
MRSLLLVARQEYRRTALRRSFLFATLGIPLLFVAVAALAVFIQFQAEGESRAPVGYVDPAGILDAALQARLPNAENRVEIRAYPDEQAAEAALRAEEIQAFWVLPATYPSSLSTDLYYLDRAPSGTVWGQFDDFVRANLVSAYPEQVQARLLEGPTVTVEDVSSHRTFGGASVINIVLPFFATGLVVTAMIMMSGYMLQVVADEKENRTMESLLTSLTPGQLIGGKAAGLLGAALTQLAMYLVAAIIVLLTLKPLVPELQALTVPWDYLGMMALFFLPTYALMAGIMIALGGAVTEVQQGQQISGILTLFFLLPIFVLPLIFENPAHPIVVALTLFPTTSFVTISLRWGLGTVPVWQLAVSWLLLVATAAVTLWAAARIFRAGMLRFGQPLRLKHALAAVRGQ